MIYDIYIYITINNNIYIMTSLDVFYPSTVTAGGSYAVLSCNWHCNPSRIWMFERDNAD